ncbi:MAG: hypothetical protein IJX19_08320, partial [Clostridia bacterium]|nr:hypothetical protein [Clostridia bacterium]
IFFINNLLFSCAVIRQVCRNAPESEILSEKALKNETKSNKRFPKMLYYPINNGDISLQKKKLVKYYITKTVLCQENDMTFLPNLVLLFCLFL